MSFELVRIWVSTTTLLRCYVKNTKLRWRPRMSGATSGMGRTEFSAQAWYQNPKKHLILGQFSNSPWTTLEAAKCDMRTRRSSVLLNPAIRDEWQNGSNPWTRQTTPSKSPISRNRKLAASVRRIKLGSGPLCGMPRRMAYSLPAFT
jgi:hypothetical protein